ncbi:MAG: DivIVA domain-containing protein [Actinomycetota bacterium]|nr:DivIVA domain-containing protein [Actinomycetota bacterium]
MSDEQTAAGAGSGGRKPLAALSDLPRPDFDVRRRGYDPEEVDAHLAAIERDRARLLAELARLRKRNTALTEQVEAADGAAEELERAMALGQETADAIIADARERASGVVAEAERDAQRIRDAERKRMAEEDKRLDGLRMAVAAEAAHLEHVTEHLRAHMSEPAARLLEIVDGVGGLHTDPEATSTLLEFAELLHRTNGFGAGRGGEPGAGRRQEAHDGPSTEPSAARLLDELAARTHAGG